MLASSLLSSLRVRELPTTSFLVSDPEEEAFTSRVSFRMELSTMLLIMVAESMCMVDAVSVSGDESWEEVVALFVAPGFKEDK